MSSDLYGFEAPFHTRSSSEIQSNGGGDLPFFSDPYIFPLDEETPSSLDPFCPSFFSFSPPSTHSQNLSLYQSKSLHPLPNVETEFGNSSVFEVKTEECKMGASADYSYNQHLFPHSYGGTGSENVSKWMMQRSFSSNSFEEKPCYLFQPPLYETPCFQSQALSSPDHTFFPPQMRRACSTGDLQNIQETHTSHTEEASFKVGRYSAEERKERISKYRAKRSQRNFNKTIKYTCRKTLADNRPRIRGRFARNDETSEIPNPKPPYSTRDEDEDDFWIEGLHEEQEDVTVIAQQYVNGYGGPQFQNLQYCGF